MKVAHVIRRFTFEEWGGTENVVWNTVKQLRKQGIEAEILATAALSQAGEEVRDGVPIRRYAYRYPYFGLSRAARLELDKKGGNPWSNELRQALIRGKYDLIHVHSGGRVAGIALEAARSCNIPCCISLHGGYSDIPAVEMEQMRLPVKGKFHYGGVWDRLTGRRGDPVAGMDAIFCVGANEYEKLTARKGRAKVYYLPNGVDVARFRQPGAPGFREEFKIPAERKVLLCVSRIDYQKGQLLLVDLLARLVRRGEDAHLLLVGPVTSGWYQEKILAAADEAGVRERLTLIPGFRPDDPRLIAAYHASNVFILPSQHEPFGIVVLEAWSAGTPVIASRVGGLAKLVADGETGLLFESGNPDALEGAYDRLPAFPALTSRALQEAETYSWGAMAEKLVQYYRECK